MVCDEVDMIGFECELMGINELKNEQNVGRIAVKKKGDDMDQSIDSNKFAYDPGNSGIEVELQSSINDDAETKKNPFKENLL